MGQPVLTAIPEEMESQEIVILQSVLYIEYFYSDPGGGSRAAQGAGLENQWRILLGGSNPSLRAF